MRAFATACLCAALAAMPFNDLPTGAGPLGEAGLEASLFALLGCVLAVAIGVPVPRARPRVVLLSMAAMAAVLVWAAAGLWVDGAAIAANEFKGRSGGEKFLLQFGLIAAQLCAAIAVYAVLMAQPSRADAIALLRRWVRFGGWIAVAVAAAEAVSFADGAPLNGCFRAVGPWIHSPAAGGTGLYHVAAHRVRSVCGEASWCGAYLAFLFPWVFVLAADGIAIVALRAAVLTAAAVTYSRTAYAAIGAEILLLGAFAPPRTFARVAVPACCAALAVFALTREHEPEGRGIAALTTFDARRSLSNLTRLSCQSSAVGMAAEHPWFGVGLGQYAFSASQYMPPNAIGDVEIARYLDPTPGTAWPPVHGLLARIAGELGVGGLVLTGLAIGGLVLALCARADAREADLRLALVCAWIGYGALCLSMDTFRSPALPVLLGASWFALARAPEEPFTLLAPARWSTGA